MTATAPVGTGAVTIVFPVFNEAEVLPLLFERISWLFAGDARYARVIFVDDGSNDGSLARLEEFRDNSELDILILTSGRRGGQDWAIRAGLAHVETDYALVSDADLQYDPGDFAALLARAAEAEIVFAIRQKLAFSLAHRSLRRIYVWLAWLAYGCKPYTEKCVLISRPALQRLLSQQTRTPYLPLDLATGGFRIAEAVVPHHRRQAGDSKVSLVEHTFRGIALLARYGRIRLGLLFTVLLFFGPTGIRIAAGAGFGVLLLAPLIERTDPPPVRPLAGQHQA